MSKVPMPSSATWQIVCRHLIRGESKDWRPIGDEGYRPSSAAVGRLERSVRPQQTGARRRWHAQSAVARPCISSMTRKIRRTTGCNAAQLAAKFST